MVSSMDDRFGDVWRWWHTQKEILKQMRTMEEVQRSLDQLKMAEAIEDEIRLAETFRLVDLYEEIRRKDEISRLLDERLLDTTIASTTAQLRALGEALSTPVISLVEHIARVSLDKERFRQELKSGLVERHQASADELGSIGV